MDSTIATYIANEQAKIKALRDEANSRERKLEVFQSAFESMQGPDVIDLNARVRPSQGSFLETALALDPAKPQQDVRRSPGLPRKKGVKVVILGALSRSPRQLKAIVESLVAQGHSLKYDHIRTELWTMKKNGLVSSPEAGVYLITEQGEALLEGLKGEPPVAAGGSSATESVADLI